MFILLIFFLGAIIGSFLNVVALRFNTGRSFVSGRSGCFSCGKQIQWYENIPLISFLFLRGRCSACKSKISWQYPCIEFVTGGLFVLGFLKFEFLLNSSVWVFLITYKLFILSLCFLVLIFLYDLKHKIIPNEFIYPLIFLSGIMLLFPQGVFMRPESIDLLAGPILFLPFFLLWLVSRGRWIGFADGKLAWAMGWLLGLVHGLSAVVLAFWIGAGFVLVLFAMLKLGFLKGFLGLTMKSEVPFGPFLIVALLIAYFIPMDFFNLSLFL